MLGDGVAPDTWYYLYVIKKDSDGSIDAMFSPFKTEPIMPTGYTYFRRIRGAVLTDSSSNIIAFFQKDNEFMFKAGIEDITDTAPTGARTLATVSVPAEMIGIFTAFTYHIALSSTWFRSTSFTDVTPGGGGGTVQDVLTRSSAQSTINRVTILTDSFSQVAYRCTVNFLSTLKLITEGFIDPAKS